VSIAAVKAAVVIIRVVLGFIFVLPQIFLTIHTYGNLEYFALKQFTCGLMVAQSTGELHVVSSKKGLRDEGSAVIDFRGYIIDWHC
jgi:hypothetical protein